MARTGTSASCIAMMKPWMDAIGFPVRPVLSPVRSLSAERREWLVDQLKTLGIA